jgi:hypothetical protein
MDRKRHVAGLLAAALLAGPAVVEGAGKKDESTAKRPAAASKATVALPDLVVDEVGLDRRCRVWVRVRNQGRGAVPPAELRGAEVAVAGRKKAVPLARAGAPGALVRPGGTVQVSTALEPASGPGRAAGGSAIPA